MNQESRKAGNEIAEEELPKRPLAFLLSSFPDSSTSDAETYSGPTPCAGTCGGVYARGTEMVLLWQRHATAQGLVTRQDAFCFRCALQDLSDQIQKLKAEIGKQIEAQAATVPLKLVSSLEGAEVTQARWRAWLEDPHAGLAQAPVSQKMEQVRWSASAETADATTSVAEVAS
jgi:hypothetical protein